MNEPGLQEFLEHMAEAGREALEFSRGMTQDPPR